MAILTNQITIDSYLKCKNVKYHKSSCKLKESFFLYHSNGKLACMWIFHSLHGVKSWVRWVMGVESGYKPKSNVSQSHLHFLHHADILCVHFSGKFVTLNTAPVQTFAQMYRIETIQQVTLIDLGVVYHRQMIVNPVWHYRRHSKSTGPSLSWCLLLRGQN